MNDEEIVSLNRMKLFARSSDLSVVTAKDMNIVVNLVEKQNSIIKNAIDYIQHNNKELKNCSEQEMLNWLYGLDKCCEIKEGN